MSLKSLPKKPKTKKIYDPVRARESKLLRDFGITGEQWLAMYTLQNGRCAICERYIYKPFNSLGRKAANVDHDHKTKRVRGLTCYHCNFFYISKNTTETAKKLVDYLSSDFDARLL